MSEGDESCTMDLNQEEFKQRIPDILQHFAADASNRREETHIEVLQRLRTAGRIPIIGFRMPIQGGHGCIGIQGIERPGCHESRPRIEPNDVFCRCGWLLPRDVRNPACSCKHVDYLVARVFVRRVFFVTDITCC